MHKYGHWVSRIEQPTTAKAFVYFMMFSDQSNNISYYVGYKHIDPANKWQHYNSSSKIVKGEYIDLCVHREIVTWYDDVLEARAAEAEQLKYFNAARADDFLNRSNGNENFVTVSVSEGDKKRRSEHQKKLMEDPAYFLKKMKCLTLAYISTNNFNVDKEELVLKLSDINTKEELDEYREDLKDKLVNPPPRTPDEMEAARLVRLEADRIRRANMTPEQRAARLEADRIRRANMTPEQKQTKIVNKRKYKDLPVPEGADIAERNKALWENEEYVKKQSEAHAKSMQDPTQIANRKKEAQRRANDPDFLEHLKAANKMATTPEANAKRAKSLQKRCTDGNKEFDSPDEAGVHHGIRADLVRKYCRTNKNGWRYL